MASKSATKEGSRDSRVWLNAALSALVEEGIDGVRVERLAKKIGVTKGSFYWHFKNRNDLHQRILAYWADESTVLVFDKIAKLTVAPYEKMLALIEEVTLERRGKFDSAIRNWSKNDPQVAEVVQKIDQQRLGFLIELLQEAGFNKRDADTRATLFYGYMVGESSVLRKDNSVEQLKILKRIIKVILAV